MPIAYYNDKASYAISMVDGNSTQSCRGYFRRENQPLQRVCVNEKWIIEMQGLSQEHMSFRVSISAS